MSAIGRYPNRSNFMDPSTGIFTSAVLEPDSAVFHTTDLEDHGWTAELPGSFATNLKYRIRKLPFKATEDSCTHGSDLAVRPLHSGKVLTVFD
jgi:hypothetical protein